jgi:hypothetical protein
MVLPKLSTDAIDERSLSCVFTSLLLMNSAVFEKIPIGTPICKEDYSWYYVRKNFRKIQERMVALGRELMKVALAEGSSVHPVPFFSGF